MMPRDPIDDVWAARAAAGWEQHPGVRSGQGLSVAERAADLVSRAAGTWSYLTVLAAAIVVAAVAAMSEDDRAGAVAVLSLVLSGIALIEISLVLMAGRRADRTARETALFDLGEGRRNTAVAEELRIEMQRLHQDLARLAAQAERSAHRPPPLS